jgi:hypothetical protein
MGGHLGRVVERRVADRVLMGKPEGRNIWNTKAEMGG